jgi:uncharacterized protein (DUF302 family)
MAIAHFRPTALFAAVLATAIFGLAVLTADAAPDDSGVIRVKSLYGNDETIERVKAAIEKKGIKFFLAIDQSQLGAVVGIQLQPSTLLIFGHPPLGIQFLTSNPDSGLDWPVRMLVRQAEDGQVWVIYTDFGWIAKRYGISNREAEFKMASDVIASVTSSVASKR